MINPLPGHSLALTESHSVGLHTHLRAAASSMQHIKHTIVNAHLISTFILDAGQFIRCIINSDVILLRRYFIIAVIYDHG